MDSMQVIKELLTNIVGKFGLFLASLRKDGITTEQADWLITHLRLLVQLIDHSETTKTFIEKEFPAEWIIFQAVKKELEFYDNRSTPHDTETPC